MIIPATLIINMGDFTTPHTFFFAIIELVIQFSNAFMQLFCHPVTLSPLSIYFWHSDMMIIFFYNVSIIVPWISK